MAENRTTPEEKLLKVIENPIDVKYKGFLHFKGDISRRLFFKRWISGLKYAKFKIPLSLKNLHNLLGIGSIIITAVGAVLFIKGNSDFRARFKNVSAVAYNNSLEKAEEGPLSADLAAAVEDAKRRNIFSSLPPAPVSVAVNESPDTGVEKLKLVGIIWSDDPQAMIEDAGSGKTFLLNTEEMVEGFRIKEISKDKVILSRNGKQWELR
ncbi:MAG: type II secretion system protein N [Candidatus Omnitrophica bacterium]|nr:type II secretion system protein N [Candidatus Omnitrophota bacterium]